MPRLSSVIRGAIGLAAVATMAACVDPDGKLLLPINPNGADVMSRYVAMGNSITAGYQSGGLNDSVQRQSYAFLVAQQAGTRFAYPSINRLFRYSPTVVVTAGCPTMLGNWASQQPTDSVIPAASRQPCSLRDATKATNILNNVAVPGAFATDLVIATNAIKTPTSGGANQFLLGGTSQIQRAIEANPTFVSLWIGNNETLQPASVGLLGGYPPANVPAMVSATEFSGGFNKAVDSLMKVFPNLKGILIGAVNVVNVPRFFSADSLGLSATKRTAFGTFTGRGAPTVVACGLPGATGWLVSIELAKNIRSGAHPNVVSCNQAATPGAGDIFMLDPTEQAALATRVAEYNTAIQAKATQYGWAYLDPNPILAAQKTGTTPAIPAFPNFTSNTRDAATSVFGALFSLDGAHPSAAGQKLIANAVIPAINAKYSLTIPVVP